MTLNELIIKCTSCEEVTVVPVLLGLEVRDYEELCPFALKKYFLSEKFSKDQKEILLDYEDRIYHGFNPYIFLTREGQQFNLNLSTEEDLRKSGQ